MNATDAYAESVAEFVFGLAILWAPASLHVRTAMRLGGWGTDCLWAECGKSSSVAHDVCAAPQKYSELKFLRDAAHWFSTGSRPGSFPAP